jgi:predicted DNA-binding transcriptional regulator YafY
VNAVSGDDGAFLIYYPSKSEEYAGKRPVARSNPGGWQVTHIERIYALHKLLRVRRMPISISDLMARLGWTRATLYRVIADLRDGLEAPIISERGKGLRYDPAAETYELPGLWFNASEIHALLVFQTLLHDIQPGLLDAEIEPLRARIEHLLGGHAAGSGELERRIRILGMAARSAGEHFQVCASALVERKRLLIDYHGRASNRLSHRHISPQRLTRYRDAWYFDAWCHESRGLRTFAIERIRAARPLDKPAREISDARLDRHYATAYGIFAGKPKHTAVLRFTSKRARWVADERWHPKQRGKFLKDGVYELRVPYGDPTELLMDILKYGPDVEVIGPTELREQALQRLVSTLKWYQ